MPITPITAAAEGVPSSDLTRRNFLTIIPVAVAAAAPTAALAGFPPEELPATKVVRIAKELSFALDDYADGMMHAVVYPSKDRVFAVGFRMTYLSTTEDPLLDAIRGVDWPLHGGEDAVIDKTYGGPLDALKEWDRPAETRAGAVSALRLALAESEGSDSLVIAMLRAALAYVESEV